MESILKKQPNDIDAFIKNEDKRFRVRACEIIIKNGLVIIIKNNVDDYYYSVGGDIHIGETIEEACLREVFSKLAFIIRSIDFNLSMKTFLRTMVTYGMKLHFTF